MLRCIGQVIGIERAQDVIGKPVVLGKTDCSVTMATTGQPAPLHSYGSLALSAVERL